MSDSAPLTRDDYLRFAGLVLILAAFLGLATFPGLVIEWMHRDGYRRTEVVVTSPDSSRGKWVSMKFAETGEQIQARRSGFDGLREGTTLPAWYNPQARFEMGFVWYDARLLSAARHPELPSGGVALGYTLATILLAALGTFLILRKNGKSKRSRRK